MTPDPFCQAGPASDGTNGGMGQSVVSCGQPTLALACELWVTNCQVGQRLLWPDRELCVAGHALGRHDGASRKKKTTQKREFKKLPKGLGTGFFQRRKCKLS